MEIHKVFINDKPVFISERKNWGDKKGETFRVIQPWKNEDGSINWFNFLTGGSWWNLIFTILIVIIVLGTLWEYSNNIQMFLDCFEIPGRLQVCVETFSPEYLRINP